MSTPWFRTFCFLNPVNAFRSFQPFQSMVLCDGSPRKRVRHLSSWAWPVIPCCLLWTALRPHPSDPGLPASPPHYPHFPLTMPTPTPRPPSGPAVVPAACCRPGHSAVGCSGNATLMSCHTLPIAFSCTHLSEPPNNLGCGRLRGLQPQSKQMAKPGLSPSWRCFRTGRRRTGGGKPGSRSPKGPEARSMRGRALAVSLPARAAHLSDQAVVGVEVPVDDVHGVKVGLGAGGMEVRRPLC